MEHSVLINKPIHQPSIKQAVLNVLLIAGVITSLVLAILLATGNIQPKSETHNNYNYNNSYYSMMHPYRKTNIASVKEYPGAGFTSVQSVIGMDGIPVLFFYRQTVSMVQFIKCKDIACTSTNPAKSINGTYLSYGYAIISSPIVGRDGLVTAVLQVFDVATYDSVFLSMHCDDIDCAHITVTHLDDEAGGFSSVHIASDGNPVVTHAKQNNVSIIHCVNPTCSKFESNTVPSVGTIHGLDSVIGLDGNLLILSTIENGSAVAVHCSANDYLCSTYDYNIIGFAGNFTAKLYVGISGAIHVIIPGSVLVCINAQCSAVLSSPVPVGPDNAVSVTIDRTGFPLLVSNNFSNVTIISCLSEDCSAYTLRTDTSLAPQQSVSQISMITGVNGFPLLVFRSSSAQNETVNLYVVGCDNHLCTPWKN